MTEPNGRSSNGTLRGMATPEADVTDRIPMVPIQTDPVVAAEPRPNVTETPPIVVKRSAPRLLAKEFTIPSGWFRAPLRAKPADDGVDGAGADDADSTTQASAVARLRTVSLGTVLIVFVAATFVGVVALMLSRRDAVDSRPEAQKSTESQPTATGAVAVPAPATASLVASADTSTAPSATAMPIAVPGESTGSTPRTAASSNTLGTGQGAPAAQPRKTFPPVAPRPASSVKPRPPIY